MAHGKATAGPNGIAMPLDAVSLRDAPEAALAAYRTRGFHLERGLVPAIECDRLLDIALSRPNATDGSFRPIPMPHRARRRCATFFGGHASNAV
jgi:hypothetical protein